MKKLLTIVLLLIAYSLSASHVHLSLTGVVSGHQFYYCSSTVDSVIVHKPGTSIGDWYHGGLGSFSADTAVVTSATQGYWYFDDGTMIEFYVNFVSISPTEPWTATSISKCVGVATALAGQTSPQPDFTYIWSTGVASPQIYPVNPGNYFVTVTGACATVTDQIEVIDYPVSKPDLGADVTVCQGVPVTLTPGTAYSSFLWTPGSSNNSSLNPTVSGMYIVRTTSLIGNCIGKDTVQVLFLTPPSKQICYAGFDTVSFKNNIYLPTNATANIESYNIYKEVSLGVWNLIGNIAADSNHFTDVNCNPQAQSYSYQLAAFDTCGNEGARSATHTTITLLSTYDQGTDTYGFTWSAYAGITVSDYYLYGIDASGATTLIGTVNGNQYFYNYVNPSSAFVKYFVGFTGPNCSAKSGSLVKSNYVQATTGINETNGIENLVSVGPNPVTDKLFINASVISAKVYNSIGVLVTEKFSLANSGSVIDFAGMPTGIYYCRIVTSNGAITKKVVKE